MKLSISDRRRSRTVAKRIEAWYDASGRSFEWRSPKASLYMQIVSEIMLQRTRAETVASFLQKFLKKYPGWIELAGANQLELSEMIRSIGLQNRRSRTLIELAQAVIGNGGDFPDSREGIEGMPGIGQYVANAVELFQIGQPRPLLDTNMARVIERYFRKREMADIRRDPWLQSIAQYLVERGSAKELNWGFLDLGALVCKPANPDCHVCPLSSGCKFWIDARSAKVGVPR